MKIVTGDQMRSIETLATRQGTSLEALMDRAGRAIADAAAENMEHVAALVLVGPGNNGGDGLVAAQYLHDQKHAVTAYTFHRDDLLRYKGPVIRRDDDIDDVKLRASLAGATIVIDALLGIGQNRAPDGNLARIVSICNEERIPGQRLLSVDVPTGVNADTGAVLNVAFRSDVTLCMGFPKRGTVLFPGAEFAGEVRVIDIGLDEELARNVQTELPTDLMIAQLLPARIRNSNKGTHGRLVVVGGSRNFMGAPALVAIAALRAGAGLVEVGLIPAVHGAVASHALEPIFRILPEHEGSLSPDAITGVTESLRRAAAVVFGPGLGLTDGTIELTRRLIGQLEQENMPPAAIDADGLNALALLGEWWHSKARLVLTPHPGEMSRLTGLSVEDVQSNRLHVASEFAAKWNQVVVLKGAGTVVADPSGRIVINPTGGPNLATGGTGDVLSGIIGGLLAQRCEVRTAAVLGVYLHGKAGDLVADQLGDTGTLASDLLAHIPRARRRILRAAGSEGT